MRRGLRIVALAAALVGAGVLQALAQAATEREVEALSPDAEERSRVQSGLLEADPCARRVEGEARPEVMPR